MIKYSIVAAEGAVVMAGIIKNNFVGGSTSIIIAIIIEDHTTISGKTRVVIALMIEDEFINLKSTTNWSQISILIKSDGCATAWGYIHSI